MKTTATTAFPTTLSAIQERIKNIDPERYARTRNYENGALTYLGPYISRGVISTRQVMQEVLEMGLTREKCEKLIQELAWRDYWQQLWIAYGDQLMQDLKHPQKKIAHRGIPKAVMEAQTGITAVDEALQHFYSTGYMHNHMRMYVAALSCNIGRAHWLQPARWLYYYLLDGDIASNHLSWQWVAGTLNGRPYYANQDNINKYFRSIQKGTYLDHTYEYIAEMELPDALSDYTTPELKVVLPKAERPDLQADVATLVYNYYNLDPDWHSDLPLQRVLLLEPSHFERYPVSQKCMQFALDLAQNIHGIKVFVGEFDELQRVVGDGPIVYKEHPSCRHYSGTEETRTWMGSVKGAYPSFFKFYKALKKDLHF